MFTAYPRFSDIIYAIGDIRTINTTEENMKNYTLLKTVPAGDSLSYDMISTHASKDDAQKAAEENWNINGRTMPLHMVENTIDRLFHPAYTNQWDLVCGGMIEYTIVETETVQKGEPDAETAAEKVSGENDDTVHVSATFEVTIRRTVDRYMSRADYDKLCGGDISPLDPEIIDTVKEAAGNMLSPVTAFDLETDYCLYNLDKDLLVVDWR